MNIAYEKLSFHKVETESKVYGVKMTAKRRTKANKKKYREKVKQKNEENAAVVAYVKQYYPWVLEAFTLQSKNK